MSPRDTDGDFKSNPIWQIINDPDFVKKCGTRDQAMLGKLKQLSTYEPEKLGALSREAFAHSTDQRTGKFMKTLSGAMTELAVGDIVRTIFSHCEVPA